MNPKVDFYFNKATRWQEEIETLRTIVLNCGLTEELKWGVPCYTFQKGNVLLIHVFKDYCALLFIKGTNLQQFSRSRGSLADDSPTEIYYCVKME